GPGGCRLFDDEVGVPSEICQKCTKREFVGPWNRDWIEKNLLEKGKINCVDRGGGIIQLAKFKKVNPQTGESEWKSNGFGGFQLRHGDIVERHLQNGDIVLMNRQPTL